MSTALCVHSAKLFVRDRSFLTCLLSKGESLVEEDASFSAEEISSQVKDLHSKYKKSYKHQFNRELITFISFSACMTLNLTSFSSIYKTST